MCIALDEDDTATNPQDFPDCVIKVMPRQDRICTYQNTLWKENPADYYWLLNDDCTVETRHWDFQLRWLSCWRYGQTRPTGIDAGNGKLYSEFPIIAHSATKALGWLVPPYFKCWGADNYLYQVFSKCQLVHPMKIDIIHHRTQDETHKALWEGNDDCERDCKNDAWALDHAMRIWWHE